MTLCVLEQLEFYHKVKYIKLCPTADLIAILNENSLLSIHTISGKAVWSLSMMDEKEKVIDIQWSSDGKYLLVKLADMAILILGREGGKKVYRGSQRLLDWIDYKNYNLFLEQGQEDFSLNLIDKAGIAHQAKKLTNCTFALLCGEEFLISVTLKDTTIRRITTDSLENPHHTVPITHFAKQIEILGNCFSQISDRLLSFGLQNIVEIGVAADEELFKALTELATAIPIRSLVSKYHTAYRTAYEFFLDEKITNMPQQAAIGEELKRQLELHQADWDRLVLWIKTLLEDVPSSTDTISNYSVKTWQKSCSSTRLFMLLNILTTGKDQWDGQVRRLIQTWSDLVKRQDKNLIQFEHFLTLPDLIREAHMLSNDQLVLRSDDMLISIDIFTGTIDRMQCPKNSKILHHHRYLSISNDGKVYLDDETQPLNISFPPPSPISLSMIPSTSDTTVFDISPGRKTLMALDETKTIIKIHAF